MKRILLTAVALTAALAAPQQASAGGPLPTFIWGATTCGGSTLQSCVEFELTQDATGRYFFSVTYASSLSSDPGVITSVGLYDLRGNPNFNFTNVTLVSAPDGKSWTAYDGEHCDLSGDAVGSPLFEACSSASPPPTANGLAIPETVVFSFTSNYAITAATMTSSGGLSARAHIQAFGSSDCSFKVDSRTGVFSSPEGGIDGCNPTVAPEPATMVLLATGLAGVAIVARRRRKQV